MPIHHQLTFPLLMAIALLASLLSVIAGRKNTGSWFVPCGRASARPLPKLAGGTVRGQSGAVIFSSP